MPKESIVLTELQKERARRLKTEGALISIYVLRAANGRCDYDNFIKKLGSKDQCQIQVIIDNIAKFGITSCSHLKRIREDIYEITTRGGVRLFAFMISNKIIIISHGMTKGTKRVQTTEIDSAIQRKLAFLSMGERQ